MADEAARALWAPTIAGTSVNPQGLAKKMTASVAGGHVGGIAGSLVADAITDRASDVAPDLPTFGRVGYLAVTDTEVAFTSPGHSWLVKFIEHRVADRRVLRLR